MSSLDSLTNHSLLDNMLLDYQIFKLNNFWYNQEYIWERWVRL